MCSLAGAAILAAGAAHAMRQNTYVTVYYTNADFTGQAVGYRSVSCNSNIRMDGVKTAYYRIEGERICDEWAFNGYWTYDYRTTPEFWFKQ